MTLSTPAHAITARVRTLEPLRRGVAIDPSPWKQRIRRSAGTLGRLCWLENPWAGFFKSHGISLLRAALAAASVALLLRVAADRRLPQSAHVGGGGASETPRGATR